MFLHSFTRESSCVFGRYIGLDGFLMVLKWASLKKQKFLERCKTFPVCSFCRPAIASSSHLLEFLHLTKIDLLTCLLTKMDFLRINGLMQLDQRY
ncbi:hypothetical protein NPIL_410451 [Nephila pilipes]|uniref:Uncharacterized protein n=1 Tax=Nephila pilipes TaxID=299642 RepID=A0A8X6TGA0_NEPPI|nr:hypothetical protein NPIL_410451 [Nephila pilipes]